METCLLVDCNQRCALWNSMW